MTDREHLIALAFFVLGILAGCVFAIAIVAWRCT